MTKQELEAAVEAAKGETKTALETVLAALNQGQRKKVCRDPAVEKLLERYGIVDDPQGISVR